MSNKYLSGWGSGSTHKLQIMEVDEKYEAVCQLLSNAGFEVEDALSGYEYKHFYIAAMKGDYCVDVDFNGRELNMRATLYGENFVDVRFGWDCYDVVLVALLGRMG